MIAKLTTGNGFGGAVRYDMKFGMDNSSMSVLLGLSGVDFSYDEDGNIKIDPRQVAFDFRQQALAYRTPDSDNARAYASQCITGFCPGDRENTPPMRRNWTWQRTSCSASVLMIRSI